MWPLAEGWCNCMEGAGSPPAPLLLAPSHFIVLSTCTPASSTVNDDRVDKSNPRREGRRRRLRTRRSLRQNCIYGVASKRQSVQQWQLWRAAAGFLTTPPRRRSMYSTRRRASTGIRVFRAQGCCANFREG
ncbi:hypothetical protein KM043_014266 [Ampulex compressa]|nr:hypothetical protein KM043_014266 [Ampulex compressa]